MYFLIADNIDEDLQVSKKIVDDIEENRAEDNLHNKESKKRHSIRDDTQLDSKETVYGSILHDPEEYNVPPSVSARTTESNEKVLGLKNLTDTKLKTNSWPEFKQTDQQYGSVRTSYEQDYFDENMSHMKYQPEQFPVNRNRHRQFEYRVVTDRPFVHSKTPKAYIAVSLIAPKPMHPQEDDFLLENELRQLKPWPLQHDYQDVEPLQSRWIKKTQPSHDENRSPRSSAGK